MTDREITEEKADQLERWAGENGEPFANDFDSKVWKVGGELLGLKETVDGKGLYLQLGRHEFGGKKHFHVTYTDNQSPRLREIGIIPGEIEQGAQTP